ncbi:MAG: T9SS type A sorting domain-containing protein [Chitinophagaceae bacterium]
MNKLSFLLLLSLLTAYVTKAQLVIGTGTKIKGDNSSLIVVNNLDVVNNSASTIIDPVVKFTGSSTINISGSATPVFSKIELRKNAGTIISLQQHIEIDQSINFSGGIIELNGKNISLNTSALLLNESENSRITGTTGGEVIINTVLSAPTAINPGNLGAIITTAASPGKIKISRSHQPVLISGNNYSINRVFTFTTLNNKNLNATLRIQYFDAELNNRNEDVLGLWSSDNNGANFAPQGFSGRSSGQNYIEKSGISSLTMHTLFDAPADGTLPITGLQFTAKRISSNQVRLEWKTVQEFNNLGFGIERKLENEHDFSTIGFVQSLATGGYSNQPLSYATTDVNNYNGKTYYRLKQQDIDGQFSYSVVRMITADNGNAVTLKAWPIPARGGFYVKADGIEKDILQFFDISGKLVHQLNIAGNTQQQVNQLSAGIYIMRLASQKDVQQKIVVQ